MSKISWQDQFNFELEKAISARQAGNEGMARVCARRAGGIVIGEYFHRQGIPVLSSSAYDRLKLYLNLEDQPNESRKIAEHLLLRVTTDHELPIDVDLIEDVKKLAQKLLGQVASP